MKEAWKNLKEIGDHIDGTQIDDSNLEIGYRFSIERVPGGWIRTVYTEDTKAINQVFIPLPPRARPDEWDR